MSLSVQDVTVIGAGVLGLSTALHLNRAGLTFALLDRERKPAVHTSGNAAGMIRHLYHHPQLTDWAVRSVRGWPEKIQSELFSQSGSIIVGREVPNHHQELFTLVSYQGRRAVFTESDGLVTPREVCLALFELLPPSQFFPECRVKAIAQEGDLWVVTTTQGDRFVSRFIFNCAGAWINEFLPPEIQLPAHSFARHLVEVCNVPDFDTGYLWDEEQEWYARQWGSDLKLVSVCDRVPAHPDTFEGDGDICNRTVEKLRKVFCTPALTSTHSSVSSVTVPEFVPGRAWSCFRTYVSDKLPVWGRDPLAPNLLWLGAFGGFGMSTAFAASEDLVEMIACDLKSPSRFLEESFLESFSPRRALHEIVV